MRITRVWVDLDGAGNVCGHGYDRVDDGETTLLHVDPNPDPFATPCEALHTAMEHHARMCGDQLTIF